MKLMEKREIRNPVHVQSVLLSDDIIALKEKTGQSSIKDAVSIAVYHYLKCKKTDGR